MNPQPNEAEKRRAFLRELRGRAQALVTICDVRTTHTQAIELELHARPSVEPTIVLSTVTPDGDVDPFFEADAEELFDALEQLRAFHGKDEPPNALDVELAKQRQVMAHVEEALPKLLALFGYGRPKPQAVPAPVVAIRSDAPTSPEPLDDDESEAP